MIEVSPAAELLPEAARRSILLVEDDEDVRALMLDFLGQSGFHALGAARGEEALDRLERDGSIGLVVSDVRMPGMTGIELADRVAERFPDVKLVLMSGYFVPQPVRVRFLRKPFRLKELLDVITEVTGMTGSAA